MDICYKKYLKGSYIKSIFMYPVTEQEICQVITNLKNASAGHDGIDAKILKIIKSHVIKPITHICNLSINNGVIPRELKLARVIPIFKSGNMSHFNNYRPISVLPVLSKVLERIIYTRLIKYFDSEDVLYKYQFGFRKNHSTQMALSILVDKLYQLISCKKHIIGVYIDLSKAFDMVNYDILLDKLYHYGIRGVALNWISNYLQDRSQYVQYNNINSNHGPIELGVPQGSILGPLLFLVYINDLPNASEVLFYLLFADDTNIFISGDSVSDICTVMNAELSKVTEWFKSNRLLLNADKTNLMVFSPNRMKYDKNDVTVCIDGVKVKQVAHTKFLGVIIDENLNWRAHINHVQNKLNKTIGILYRARAKLYTNTLKTLYTSLVYPYLTYCLTIWGHTYKSYIKPLYLTQKKIIRLITFSDRLAHTKPLFEKLRLLNIYDAYVYFTCIFVYKYYNMLLPDIFNGFYEEISLVHNYDTRNSDKLRPKLIKNEICSFNVKVQGTKNWNTLPEHIRNSKTLSSFKYQLRQYIQKKQ